MALAMSAHIKRKESPGQALERVCQNHVDQALANLQKAHVPDAVHDVRKEIKKLRAIFRLAREALGHKEYRKAANVLRLAAKPLAVSRDARVVQKAFENLVKSRARQFPITRTNLQTHSSRAERSFVDSDFGAVAKYILKKVGRQLEDLGLKRIGWREIRVSLEKSYQRGRDAFQRAMQAPSPEHFHAWRKQAKEFWYQLEFLCPDWPPQTKAMLDGLEKLGEELGDDHDLVLLADFTKKQHEPGAETTKLQKLIVAQRKRHGASIRRLGARLYAKLPAAVCARVEKDWKAWRELQDH